MHRDAVVVAMADGEDLRPAPRLPMNGLSGGTVPSSFRRSTFPKIVFVACASGRRAAPPP